VFPHSNAQTAKRKSVAAYAAFFRGRAAKPPKQGKGLSQKQGSFSMLKATAKPIKSIIIPAGADLQFVPVAETEISL
jgi:hypothetical protein